VVGVLGILHSTSSRRAGRPASPGQQEAQPAAGGTQAIAHASGNVAMTSDEQAAAVKEKDLDAINNALVGQDGGVNAMLEIASRLESRNAEVRTAAREAAVHLGETNIIPYLNTAMQNIQDPREKVAIMDAIDYLRLSGAEAGPDAVVAAPGGSKPVPPVVERRQPKQKGASKIPPAGAVPNQPAGAPAQGSP
jgi:hypothetical protein